MASRFWWGVSFGFLPIFTPRALARSRPSPVRADQFALEFRKPPENRQHQTPMRRRGVCPRIAKRAEASSFLGDRA